MSWFSRFSGNDAARTAFQRAKAQGAAAEQADPNSTVNLKNQSNALMQGFNQYNPQQALNSYAQGAWGSISDALKQTLGQQKGAAVGAGRLDTGFYDQDNGTVINQATKQLSDSIAQQSLGAESLGLRSKEDYADLLTGRETMAENDARDEAERQRRNKSGLAGAIGTGIGYLAGGPVGGYVGGGIAGAIFS